MWLFSEIRSIGDIPKHYGRITPDKPALIDGSGALTFAQLDANSNRVAHALRGLGVQALNRVAILSKNTPRYYEVLFGANRLDAAMLPLNWRLATPELAAIIEDASPIVLIVDREYEAIAYKAVAGSGKSCRIVAFDSVDAAAQTEWKTLCAQSSDQNPGVDVNPLHTSILMYTSGTTGRPKGVQLSHQGQLFLRLCEHLEPSFRYAENDVMLTVMPLFHAMGLSLSTQALYSGITVAVYPMPDTAELMRLIARDRPTVLPLVPTVIQMLLDHPDAANADYSSVRAIIYAGAGIGKHLLKRAMQAIACDFIQFYGATETACGVTFLRPADHRLEDEAVLASCGSPLPLIEIKVMDAEGREVPDGTVGEFWIRSPSLSTGYYRQPELTAAAFKDGWYRSGDGGFRDARGLLTIVDRVKDMIISGGENVYSTEVEQALYKLKGVQMCAAVGLPDSKWGERVVAAIIADPTAGLTSERVIAHCRELIAGYKVPKQVVFRSALPMTASGKVQKCALREELVAENAKT
ncbi:MAG: class I adenylate-forming enzyme family protein [Panacagrimonas sp.]